MSIVNPPLVPIGLRELVKNFAKDILCKKPQNLAEYAVEYFEKMIPQKPYQVKGFELYGYGEAIAKTRRHNHYPISAVFAIFPKPLTQIIKEFIKAILRENPQNLVQFAVEYFRRLKEENNVFEVDYSSYINYTTPLTVGQRITCTCGRTLTGLGVDNVTSANHERNGEKEKEQLNENVEKVGAKDIENNIQKTSTDLNLNHQVIKSVLILQRFFRFKLKKKMQQHNVENNQNNSVDNGESEIFATTQKHIQQDVLTAEPLKHHMHEKDIEMREPKTMKINEITKNIPISALGNYEPEIIEDIDEIHGKVQAKSASQIEKNNESLSTTLDICEPKEQQLLKNQDMPKSDMIEPSKQNDQRNEDENHSNNESEIYVYNRNEIKSTYGKDEIEPQNQTDNTILENNNNYAINSEEFSNSKINIHNLNGEEENERNMRDEKCLGKTTGENHEYDESISNEEKKVQVVENSSIQNEENSEKYHIAENVFDEQIEETLEIKLDENTSKESKDASTSKINEEKYNNEVTFSTEINAIKDNPQRQDEQQLAENFLVENVNRLENPNNNVDKQNSDVVVKLSLEKINENNSSDSRVQSIECISVDNEVNVEKDDSIEMELDNVQVSSDLEEKDLIDIDDIDEKIIKKSSKTVIYHEIIATNLNIGNNKINEFEDKIEKKEIEEEVVKPLGQMLNELEIRENRQITENEVTKLNRNTQVTECCNHGNEETSYEIVREQNETIKQTEMKADEENQNEKIILKNYSDIVFEQNEHKQLDKEEIVSKIVSDCQEFGDEITSTINMIIKDAENFLGSSYSSELAENIQENAENLTTVVANPTAIIKDEHKQMIITGENSMENNDILQSLHVINVENEENLNMLSERLSLDSNETVDIANLDKNNKANNKLEIDKEAQTIAKNEQLQKSSSKSESEKNEIITIHNMMKDDEAVYLDKSIKDENIQEVIQNSENYENNESDIFVVDDDELVEKFPDAVKSIEKKNENKNNTFSQKSIDNTDDDNDDENHHLQELKKVEFSHNSVENKSGSQEVLEEKTHNLELKILTPDENISTINLKSNGGNNLSQYPIEQRINKDFFYTVGDIQLPNEKPERILDVILESPPSNEGVTIKDDVLNNASELNSNKQLYDIIEENPILPDDNNDCASSTDMTVQSSANTKNDNSRNISGESILKENQENETHSSGESTMENNEQKSIKNENDKIEIVDNNKEEMAVQTISKLTKSPENSNKGILPDDNECESSTDMTAQSFANSTNDNSQNISAESILNENQEHEAQFVEKSVLENNKQDSVMNENDKKEIVDNNKEEMAVQTISKLTKSPENSNKGILPDDNECESSTDMTAQSFANSTNDNSQNISAESIFNENQKLGAQFVEKNVLENNKQGAVMNENDKIEIVDNNKEEMAVQTISKLTKSPKNSNEGILPDDNECESSTDMTAQSFANSTNDNSQNISAESILNENQEQEAQFLGKSVLENNKQGAVMNENDKIEIVDNNKEEIAVQTISKLTKSPKNSNEGILPDDNECESSTDMTAQSFANSTNDNSQNISAESIFNENQKLGAQFVEKNVLENNKQGAVMNENDKIEIVDNNKEEIAVQTISKLTKSPENSNKDILPDDNECESSTDMTAQSFANSTNDNSQNISAESILNENQEHEAQFVEKSVLENNKQDSVMNENDKKEIVDNNKEEMAVQTISKLTKIPKNSNEGILPDDNECKTSTDMTAQSFANSTNDNSQNISAESIFNGNQKLGAQFVEKSVLENNKQDSVMNENDKIEIVDKKKEEMAVKTISKLPRGPESSNKENNDMIHIGVENSSEEDEVIFSSTTANQQNVASTSQNYGLDTQNIDLSHNLDFIKPNNLSLQDSNMKELKNIRQCSKEAEENICQNTISSDSVNCSAYNVRSSPTSNQDPQEEETTASSLEYNDENDVLSELKNLKPRLPRELLRSNTDSVITQLPDTEAFIKAQEHDGDVKDDMVSYFLEEDIHAKIRQKIFACSLSETNSDSFDVVVDKVDDNGSPPRSPYNDENIETALVNVSGNSTDTESTIVSAATKIQANARGYLTRQRLRRESHGTKSTAQDEQKASFGNAAINESLEHLVKDAAAKKIQRFLRQVQKDRLKYTIKSPITDGTATSTSDYSLAARRMTLQRGDALRNDSLPDEETALNAKATKDQPKRINMSAKTYAYTSTDRRLMWQLIRRNSMPVQIHSDVFRVVPKHMKKRVSSAELKSQSTSKFFN